MGRRKIAIEPITHERNRSVTFLKRKHGLFKKAYELGVLCSVDVAVIIFEEKPGHHLKLYQYCSSDVHDMVQRHIRHDGEKDTRGPADFSGVPSTKFEDFGDGDEDEVDDDEDDVRRGVKRPNDGHVKSEDIPLDDLNYSQSHIYGTGSSIHGMNTSMPIPPDRRLQQQQPPTLANKRVRTGAPPSGPGSRSPRSTQAYISPTFGRSQHSDNSFFTGPNSSQTFNPESNFDATHPSRDQLTNSRSGSGGTPSYPPRSTAYDAALYTPVIRPSHSIGSSSNGGGATGGEGFKFLDGDSRSRAPTTSGHLGTNIDWPDHSHNSGYSSSAPAATNESTWLDFLNPSHGSTHSGGNPVINGADVSGRRNSQSWERGPISSNRSSMNSAFGRSVPGVGDDTGRSRLNSSGSAGDDEASVSGGSSVIGNTGISIKKEKDIGG